jgi:hypothetical protein
MGKSGDVDYQGRRAISGLLPAIANGQPLTFEQAASSVMPQDSGLFSQVLPNGGTSLTAIGTTVVTAVGTISHPAQAATNYLTQTRRWLTTSAATAGSLSTHRQSTTLFWRGDATRRGGFKCVLTVGLEAMAAGQRGFFGVTDSLAAPSNVDPLSNVGSNKIGLAFASNTGNWQIIWNASGTAPTVTDLGSSFPINITDLLELTVSCDPNGNGFQWTVKNLATGAIATGFATVNIPVNTAFMSPVMWMTNNATAAAVAFSSAGWKATPSTVFTAIQTAGYTLLGSVSVPTNLSTNIGTVTLPTPGFYLLFPNIQTVESIGAGNFFQLYCNNIKAISDTGGGSPISAPGIVAPIQSTTNNFVVTLALFHLNATTLTTRAGSTSVDGSSVAWIKIG